MPTPKPGQIRCPTCHRPTPMAAFCTQCGAAIPSNTQARPRGMDRQELDARIRQRRPGEGRMRRGASFDRSADSPAGYVPFEPAPEDSHAYRQDEEPADRVDNTPADFDDRSQPEPSREPEPSHAREWQSQPEPSYEPPPPAEPSYEPEQADSRGWEQPRSASDRGWAATPDATRDEPQPYAGEPYIAGDLDPDESYGAQEDAYPYPYSYAPEEEPRRGGRGIVPIIGFAVLAVLALGIGAALAGILGAGGAANASPTATASQSQAASTEATTEPTPSEGQGSATPEPTDGPVAFPDGALITVQPCATQKMSFDGCEEDGSTITKSTMWVWIGFQKASGSDTFTLELRSEGQTVDEQDSELGSILDCPETCSGYLIGAAYRDLDAGEYQLIVRRNGDFADSATFTVES